MGRPPLGIISTTVRLPKAVLERIDVLLGPHKRAEFIREAVENELARRGGGGAEPPSAAKPTPRPATEQARFLGEPGKSATGAALPVLGSFERKPYQKGQKRPR